MGKLERAMAILPSITKECDATVKLQEVLDAGERSERKGLKITKFAPPQKWGRKTKSKKKKSS